MFMEFLLIIIIGLLTYIAFFTPEKRELREKNKRIRRREKAKEVWMASYMKQWKGEGDSFREKRWEEGEDIFDTSWPEEKD